jgi:hypothetical protein
MVAKFEIMNRLAKPIRVAMIAIFIVIAAEALSGCVMTSFSDTTVVPATVGEVTGTAYPCIGVGVGAGIPVTVTLRQGSHVITSQSVRYPHPFLLSAQPGRYELSSSASTSRPRSILIRAGLTTRVKLPTACK